MYSFDEVCEKVDENIIGGVEDMFYHFDSEKALTIWNKYCDTELADFQERFGLDEKVYHNDPNFFIEIEMKRNGLTTDEILERVRLSGSNYNPNHRYITIVCRHDQGEKEDFYMTGDNATELTDADPDFAVYLIGLFATNYSDSTEWKGEIKC